MSEEILINVTPQETRVAVTYLGTVQELHIERTSQRGLVGNIYLGKVSRVLPGMQSAFIDIGLDRAAFLHVGDIWDAREGDTVRPIERILHEGQNLLVQVIKDPISAKGARLSTQISMAGRFLVYLPQETRIGISQKIEDEAERELLRERGAPVIGVSPIVGDRALKGAAGKMMHELGHEVSARRAALEYYRLIDGFVIDAVDETAADNIRACGIEVAVAPTIMRSEDDRVALAQVVLDLAQALRERKQAERGG